VGESLRRILFASIAALAGTFSCIGATDDFADRMHIADNAATRAPSLRLGSTTE